MKTPREDWKRYLLVFSITLLIGGSPFALNYLFLRRSFEVTPYSEIVDEQLRTQAVYGSSLNDNTFRYKLRLVERVRPDVVAVGSSRVMQIRKDSFNTSFVNAGGAFAGLDQGALFVDELLKIHRPKLIILNVDSWWFNPRFVEPREQRTENVDETDLSLLKHVTPLQWLREGKITRGLYLKLLRRSGPYFSPYTTYPGLGVRAIGYSSGFRADGSYFYTHYAFKIPEITNFSYIFEELGQISKGENDRVNFGLDSFESPELIAKFQKIVDRIRRDGVEVVLVAMPVMPKFILEVKKKYGDRYLKGFSLPVAGPGVEFYDLTYAFTHDPKTIDCEYLDQWHLGEVAQVRMMLEILKRNPNSILGHYVRKEFLQASLARNRGRVLLDWEGERLKKREVDFLGLGCAK